MSSRLLRHLLPVRQPECTARFNVDTEEGIVDVREEYGGTVSLKITKGLSAKLVNRWKADVKLQLLSSVMEQALRGDMLKIRRHALSGCTWFKSC